MAGNNLMEPGGANEGCALLGFKRDGGANSPCAQQCRNCPCRAYVKGLWLLPDSLMTRWRHTDIARVARDECMAITVGEHVLR